ncbi:MAG: hypothetical protein ACOH12_00635 [Parvibaculaceae bacterium]
MSGLLFLCAMVEEDVDGRIRSGHDGAGGFSDFNKMKCVIAGLSRDPVATTTEPAALDPGTRPG